MENEFHRHYKERVMPALQKLHGYKNVQQIPKVEKVVINTSVGSQSDVKQALEEAKAELGLITGQRPMETLAKKSIRSEEHTSELQSPYDLVCRLLLEKKKKK